MRPQAFLSRPSDIGRLPYPPFDPLRIKARAQRRETKRSSYSYLHFASMHRRSIVHRTISGCPDFNHIKFNFIRLPYLKACDSRAQIKDRKAVVKFSL